jgi:hypothetical protein
MFVRNHLTSLPKVNLSKAVPVVLNQKDKLNIKVTDAILNKTVIRQLK